MCGRKAAAARELTLSEGDRGELGASAAARLDRSRPRRSRAFPAGSQPHPPGDTRDTARHHQLPGAERPAPTASSRPIPRCRISSVASTAPTPAASATFEADIRLPLGVTREQVLTQVDNIMKTFPEATVRESNRNMPSWVDPDCEIIRIVQRNVEELRLQTAADREPRRHRGSALALSQHPGLRLRPIPNGIGWFDEHVDLEDFLRIVRTHALSAYDFLAA